MFCLNFLHQKLHMFLTGKEVNEDEIVPTDDMLFTKGQLYAARDGILLFTKWGNEKGKTLANTVVPYSFDSGISNKERRIVTNAVKKFNIDISRVYNNICQSMPAQIADASLQFSDSILLY